VTAENPKGSITNLDLELAGGIIHLDCISQCYDIREHTVLSKGDNLSTTFWERKGSTSTNSPPAYLLRQFGMHQQFHRYVSRFDYTSGPSNPIADSLSRKFSLNWSDQLSNIMPFLPQHALPQVWTPSKQVISAVILALLQKKSNKESLLVSLPVQPPTGISGKSSQVNWASTPFSKPTSNGNKVPFLQIFAVRVRCGELSASGNTLRAQLVEDYVRHVAQAFLNVGAKDPRLNLANLMDFRLHRMVSS
jgi:hypothetical protein